MTKDEFTQLRARIVSLFRGGDDDEEIQRIFNRNCINLDFPRAWSALDEYALQDGGAKRRFIPGKFLRIYEAQPAPKRVVLVDREAQAREHQLAEARKVSALAAIREEREQIREDLRMASVDDVDAIIAQLVEWGAPRPAGDRATWPFPYAMAVSDLMRNRMRAAPTSAGYYEQVRDDRGQWVDDPTRPFRLLTARAWWQTYGVAGLVARGLAPVG